VTLDILEDPITTSMFYGLCFQCVSLQRRCENTISSKRSPKRVSCHIDRPRFCIILLAHSVSKLILRTIEPISAEVTTVTAKVTGENAPAPTTQLFSKWRISFTMKKKGWHSPSCPQNSSTLEPNGSYQKEAWGVGDQ
jgi:hypothetical protein